MKRFLWLAAACALVGAGAAVADTTGDQVTLYPASQGQQTQAAWKAQEGEQDDQGMARQAILLEKDSTDPDAAAAAHVLGFEATPVKALISLSYDHRIGTVCTPTDPRWTLFIQGRKGKHYIVNIGCTATAKGPAQEKGWLRHVAAQPLIRLLVMRKGGPDAFAGTIEGLALAFDRSNGYVFVDDLSVRSRYTAKTWTYAGDNSNGVPGAPPTFTADQLALMAQPLSADELTDADTLMASMTPDEAALVYDDADPS